MLGNVNEASKYAKLARIIEAKIGINE